MQFLWWQVKTNILLNPWEVVSLSHTPATMIDEHLKAAHAQQTSTRDRQVDLTNLGAPISSLLFSCQQSSSSTEIPKQKKKTDIICDENQMRYETSQLSLRLRVTDRNTWGNWDQPWSKATVHRKGVMVDTAAITASATEILHRASLEGNEEGHPLVSLEEC